MPDFFVIGVVRGGTTSMYHYLDQHPSIVKSAYDELGFFDDNFKLGWKWYRSLFPTNLQYQLADINYDNDLNIYDIILLINNIIN